MLVEISEQKMQAYLDNERQVAQTTREHAVKHVEKVFRQGNPGVSIEASVWTDNYYCWHIAVFPTGPRPCTAIASYWVEKFPTEFTASNKKTCLDRIPNSIFVEFAELSD